MVPSGVWRLGMSTSKSSLRLHDSSVCREHMLSCLGSCKLQPDVLGGIRTWAGAAGRPGQLG